MLLDLLSRQTADTQTRSLTKTLTWRMVAGFDTFMISWFITGKVFAAASIIGVEALTKILWYYLHERVWEHVTWGRYRPSWAEHVSTLWNSKKSK